MNLTRTLGAVTLTVGGILLLSEPILGQNLLVELTGSSLTHLRLLCAVALIVGVVGIRLGRQEEKEGTYDKGGQKL